jgi:hypothetical protein
VNAVVSAAVNAMMVVAVSATMNPLVAVKVSSQSLLLWLLKCLCSELYCGYSSDYCCDYCVSPCNSCCSDCSDCCIYLMPLPTQ